ncbi:ATP-binding protein [Crenobacter cavernae]|uniref:histidine kinase n=1 Tax=Crenobacter cavernae TaxID=2290923 RepID=A0A345Y9H8_9NEIS|nr:ATP-binding protein [Crenobacter cavernae]AXK40580.1 PAS domain-containing sensor histidine kinase [Crenobacter cavernae]
MKPTLEPKRSPRPLWLMSALSLLALLFTLSGLFYLLYRDWVDEQRDGLIQEMLWLEQSLRLQMQSHREWGEGQALDIAEGRLDEEQFRRNVRAFLRENRELAEVQRIGDHGEVRWDGRRVLEKPAKLAGDQYDAVWRASRLLRPAYGEPYRGGAENKVRIDLAVPLVKDGRYQGSVRLTYQLDLLLQQQVPWWIASKYHVGIVDVGGKLLASKSEQAAHPDGVAYQIGFDPPGHGLSLRAVSYRVGIGLTLPVMSGFILFLTLSLAFTVWRIRRHVRERAAAERTLAHEVSFRQAMEDSMKGGLVSLDRAGRIERVNRAFCQLTGYDADALVGLTRPYPFWPADEAVAQEEVFARALVGDVPEQGLELSFLRASGERVEVRLFITPLIGGGTQRGWIASLYDVTEVRRQRIELKAAHERFLAVLNGLDAGVCVTGCDHGELLYANPAFGRLWWRVEPDAGYCPLLPRLAEPGGAPLEFTLDDGRRWFQLQRRRIAWVDGTEAWLDILADVTEAHEREARERAQAERFQTTSRLIAMGEMASSLAHELNQPLTAINTYASGLIRRLPDDGSLPKGTYGAVEAIAEQARRAGQIVNSIRAFIKKHEPQLEWSDPERMVSRAVSLAEPLANKHGVRLTLEPDARPLSLQVDPVLIEQVLINLIKNAVEALVSARTARPHVQVRTHVGAAYWRVEVADNGPGLSDAMQANLFTPFYSTKPEGMGIGLNICRSIVEFHRGEFGVHSTLSGGCVFWFTLPLSRPGPENKTASEDAVE